MPQAKLTVSLPDRAWVGEVSRHYPNVTFTVLAALPRSETGVGLVEITGPDRLAVVEAMREHEALVSLDLLGESPERVLAQFETAEPLLLFSVQESGVPLEPPVEITDGRATVEVTASQDRLSRLGEQLESFGLPFTVEYVRRSLEPSDRVLTDRQRDLLVAAVEAGYYDTPRDCSLTELADDLGMAKSTVSETLHRAEEAVVKEFVSDIRDELLAAAT